MFITDSEGGINQFSTWQELDLGYYLDKVDFVVIELNDAAVHMESSGFVEYLDSYLDEYLKENTVADEEYKSYYLNFSADDCEDVQNSKGVWAFEAGEFAWASDSMYVVLQNSNISQKGIEIELGIPEQILANQTNEIIVYVNQEKVLSTIVNKAENIVLALEAEHIVPNPDDIYEIEIYSQHCFNPYKSGESIDNRDLALRIYYIGEMR